MIEKIIHQTWKNNKLNNDYLKSIKYYKKIYPDYKHILWDDKKMRKFIKKYYKWFLYTYDNYKYNIQRCDSWRYFVLYHYGGIYSDLDIIPKKYLKDLESYDLVIPITENSNLNLYKFNLTNSFYASSKRNDFMLYCMNNLIKMKNKFKMIPHLHIMCSAGPSFISLNYEIFFEGKIKDNHLIIKPEFFNPGKKSFFKHTQGCSWHNWDSKIIKIISNIDKRLILLFLCVFIKKIYKSKKKLFFIFNLYIYIRNSFRFNEIRKKEMI